MERVLAVLDALDGDADAEPDHDSEEAHEGCCDAADDDLSSHPCRLHSGPVAGPGTPEDEEPDADGEASLGWPEAPGRNWSRDQSMNHQGAGVDAYRADLEHDTADAEPWLGWETDGHQGCGALASGYDNMGLDREGGVGPTRRRRPFRMPGEFKPQLPPVWLPVRHPALPPR